MSKPVTAVLLGAGSRGYFSYGPYALAHPDELKIVAVAEPHPVRRERFASAHGIPRERQFVTWEDLLAQAQIADTLFNMTQDQTHHPSTIAALNAGYEESRTMRYDGARATLRGKFDYRDGWIEIHDHLTGRRETLDVPATASGHGGGDFGIVRSFVRAVRGEGQPLTTARESLESHLMAFAAEESRLNSTVVAMNDFRLRAEAG
jgi:predicted dehydrogenase